MYNTAMKERNVTIYIDAANLVKGSKFLSLGYKIENLLKFFIYKYKANRCVYFSAYFSNMETEYRFLESLGVELVFREMSKVGDEIKANCDVDFTKRIVLDVEGDKVEDVILVTGDGDFATLADYIKSKNKIVKLFSPSINITSYLLTKRQYLNIVYLDNVIGLVQKGKGPAIHARVEGTLFVNSSITIPKKMSSYSGFQIGVFAFIKKENKILLVQDATREQKWALPGGGINFQEIVTDCVAREIKEEIGVNVNVINLLGIFSQQKSPGVVVVFNCDLLNENFVLDKNEVQAVNFFNIAEIEKMKIEEKIKPAQYHIVKQILNTNSYPIYNTCVPSN